ncbi:hypothetical protein BLS_002068 [Venturia inaequalis]|uniref:Glutaminase GtaA n=2 Tax=Venturia inaequalis TaxID=5025 RepID=A0A8H3UYF8_VENIN|nr:hypothetical protein BLS_002068 [Venturia inaequalis]KAE9979622.1 hypothetical protein EG328_000789 [Venturia inaequalis]RDI79442.1 hypothetical protein Vi05172_g10641 [Venturia inaequalis]
MTILSFVVAILLSILTLGDAASTFSPARPPALPLAVKSPYLSTWVEAGTRGGNGGYLAGEWARHWAGRITAWSGVIRVDGQAFVWMGDPLPGQGVTYVDQVSYSYTSTKSIFTMDVAGKVAMTITFLSPVNPDDLKRQSLTLSYMQVSVTSKDGKSHEVQLYTDISAEWASGEDDAIVEWKHTENDKQSYHQVHRQTQITFDENDKPNGNGMANWGTVYYATDKTSSLTVASGKDNAVRGSFVKTGKLDGSKDTNFRAVNKDYPVFAYAVELGRVTDQPKSTLFTIGLLQQQAVQFLGADGLQALPALWTSYFSSEESALLFFHNDFAHQSEVNAKLDTMVADDTKKAAGQNYTTVTSLAVRQSFGATQLVGTQNKTYLFMKEISSNGNTQTVDVIFPLHPILLYLNPKLIKLLLAPLYENQESGHYPNQYSMHDLGSHYPNATGHPDGKDEEMPVEECGNMLIMTLAYAQRTNDIAYLKAHYPILVQWSNFLVNDSLIPANQLSTDDFAGKLQNQTNLALKGIIGIGAMGEIARLTGNSTDAKKYSDISKDFIAKWQVLGINKNPGGLPHTSLAYGDSQSHGLLYNIWADLELGLNLVPKSVYDMQSAWYPTVAAKYGVPLDTRHAYTKGDWEMFTAAASSPQTRDMFIGLLARWIGETNTNRAYTDLYDAYAGGYPGITFVARPVMGGTFALLVSSLEKRSSMS